MGGRSYLKAHFTETLARALGIPVARATTEETMSETKETKAKGTKRTKAVKGSKPKKERTPKEDQPKRVFAFRLHDTELEAIHKTAGPRNASKFIRAVAAAFAAEDEGAFKAVLKEAREARA